MLPVLVNVVAGQPDPMAMRGFEHWTMADVQRAQRKEAPKAKRAKYGSVKTTANGIQFDSAKEARRYQELLNLVKTGKIRNLRTQPHYTLCALVINGPDLHNVNAGTIATGFRKPVCEYHADFEYEELFTPNYWLPVVEDVKSTATRKKEIYRLKRKLFEAQYGVTIREV